MPGALLTDLYQLTMLQAYFDGGMNAPASFDDYAVRELLESDVVGLQDVRLAGEPLLEPVIAAGRRELSTPGLDASREQARRQLAALPARLRELEAAGPYLAAFSPALEALAADVDARSGTAVVGTHG